MNELQNLIVKRRKLRSWLTTGIILFVSSIIVLLSSVCFIFPFLMFFSVALLILSLIPFGIADNIESKIFCKLRDTFTERLKWAINDDKVCEDLYVNIELKNSGTHHLVISGDNLCVDELSTLAKQILQDMYKELNIQLDIKLVISKHYSNFNPLSSLGEWICFIYF